MKYRIVAIIRAVSHPVFPPYHPALNPIENIWIFVMQSFSSRNVTYKLKGLVPIAVAAFNSSENFVFFNGIYE